jgi:hypothetical protein
MEINNLNNLNTIRSVGGAKDTVQVLQKKELSAAGTEKTDKTDTFSGGIYSSGSELEPRVELLNSILEKIQSGTYNSQDIIGKVAEKIIGEGLVSGMQASTELSNNLNIEEQRNKIGTEFYSDAGIIKATAVKLIDSLGIDLLK